MTTFAPGESPIALVRWPEEADRRAALAEAGRPRLLLLEPGAAPPSSWDQLEDWTRLPADPVELEARMATLLQRVPADRPAPLLDGDGVLRHGAGWVALPPVEARITAALLARPDAVVARQDLLDAGWPAGPGSRSGSNILDGRIKLLRRRLAKVAMQIHTVRGVGFVLTY
ncbi:winged helix-turn-helix domain-containing protein [Aquihabitans sp. McL0605]|uniref:winged helix-turn-helix domain-containing protein n=1 Tax=Aquihabitans sp. McL0605 TaxID=3415671 RepID=UPI003CF1141F